MTTRQTKYMNNNTNSKNKNTKIIVNKSPREFVTKTEIEKQENVEEKKDEGDEGQKEQQKNNRDDRDQNGEEEKVKENDNK